MAVLLTPTSEAKGCPYKGETYPEGDTWYSSTCEQCKCKAGVAFCKKMTCPNPPSQSFSKQINSPRANSFFYRDPFEGRCSWVGLPENECCPVCLGCQTETG